MSKLNFTVGSTAAYRRSIHLVIAVDEASRTVTLDYPAVDFVPVTVGFGAVMLNAPANSRTSQNYADTMRAVHERRKKYAQPRSLKVKNEHIPVCPTCRAGSGLRCRTARGGEVSYIHAARKVAPKV